MQDIADLITGLSMRVGPARAVASATRVLGHETMAAALPYVRLLALPRTIRRPLRNHPEVLAALRAEIADVTGTEAPETGLRISASTVIGLAVAGGAIYILLPQIGSFQALLGALRGASWSWLSVAFVSGLLTAPAAGLSYWGSARRSLPIIQASAVQLASAFTGRLTPAGAGGIGLNMLFMERAGMTRQEAVSAAALNMAGGAIVHAALFFIAAAVLGLGTLRHGIEIPTSWPILGAVLGVLVAAGLLLTTPFGRRRVVKPAVEVGRTLVETIRRPVRAAALFGGSAGVTVFNALAFVATVQAFGSDISALQVAAVYVGGTAIASAAPTPGGLGAVEAALVAGLTGVGMVSEPAVAAVLSFRLLTFWLPILPGMATYRVLQHRNVV